MGSYTDRRQEWLRKSSVEGKEGVEEVCALEGWLLGVACVRRVRWLSYHHWWQLAGLLSMTCPAAQHIKGLSSKQCWSALFQCLLCVLEFAVSFSAASWSCAVMMTSGFESGSVLLVMSTTSGLRFKTLWIWVSMRKRDENFQENKTKWNKTKRNLLVLSVAYWYPPLLPKVCFTALTLDTECNMWWRFCEQQVSDCEFYVWQESF